MKPQPFKESNLNLGAGDNPNTEDMPVAVSTNLEMTGGQDIPFTVSSWKVTPEELQRIQETGEIWISIMGFPPPPICVLAYHPFKECGFKALEPL